MEARCVVCEKHRDCPHVEWVVGDKGLAMAASDIPYCNDFQLNRAYMFELLAETVMEADEEDYFHVGVSPDQHSPAVNIQIHTNTKYDDEEGQRRIDEIINAVQLASSEHDLGLANTVFNISFVYEYGENEVPDQIPDNLEDMGHVDGGRTRALDNLFDAYNKMVDEHGAPNQMPHGNLKDFQFPGGFHRVEGEDMMAPRECPICGYAMRKTCSQCGYEPEEENESWMG